MKIKTEWIVLAVILFLLALAVKKSPSTSKSSEQGVKVYQEIGFQPLKMKGEEISCSVKSDCISALEKRGAPDSYFEQVEIKCDGVCYAKTKMAGVEEGDSGWG